MTVVAQTGKFWPDFFAERDCDVACRSLLTEMQQVRDARAGEAELLLCSNRT
jgi:hypothetical protein